MLQFLFWIAICHLLFLIKPLPFYSSLSIRTLDASCGGGLCPERSRMNAAWLLCAFFPPCIPRTFVLLFKLHTVDWFYQGSHLKGPTLTALSANPAVRNAWPRISHLSSVVNRPSSVVSRPTFRSSSFRNFFYSKLFIIEPIHGAPPALNRLTMG